MSIKCDVEWCQLRVNDNIPSIMEKIISLGLKDQTYNHTYCCYSISKMPIYQSSYSKTKSLS